MKSCELLNLVVDESLKKESPHGYSPMPRQAPHEVHLERRRSSVLILLSFVQMSRNLQHNKPSFGEANQQVMPLSSTKIHSQLIQLGFVLRRFLFDDICWHMRFLKNDVGAAYTALSP